MWDGVEWSHPVDISVSDATPPFNRCRPSRSLARCVGWRLVYVEHGLSKNPLMPAPGANLSISPQGVPAYWNDIVVDDHGTLHVVYSDDALDLARTISDGWCVSEDCSRVYYIRSTDSGASWSKPEAISPGLASGGRVMIAKGPSDSLYVVWSTERYAFGEDFITSENGFTFSLDGGESWSEAEEQLLETGDVNRPLDYWLSVAVDSKNTIHVIASGSRRASPTSEWARRQVVGNSDASIS